MKLKTIEQHNTEKQKVMDKIRRKLRRTGVACPKCGKEMLKDNGILTFDPPQRNVICENCGHRDIILEWY